jgi:hypothetical protein
MALPNGAGGYQLGDGNLSEPVLGYVDAPLTQAGTATLTAAQVTAGILIVGSGATTAQTYTLPSATAANGVDSIVSSANVGSTFDLSIINLGTSSGTAALAMGSGTGFSDGGNATTTVAITSSALYRFRKTGEGTFSVYKVA